MAKISKVSGGESSSHDAHQAGCVVQGEHLPGLHDGKVLDLISKINKKNKKARLWNINYAYNIIPFMEKFENTSICACINKTCIHSY